MRISIEKLATTILKLANMSKEADKVVKSARDWESKTLNNEVEIEETEVHLAGDLVEEALRMLRLFPGPRLATLEQAHGDRLCVGYFL